MAIKKKISELPPCTDFDGLWTIGVDGGRRSVKVSLGYIAEVVNEMQSATTAANTAASTANTAAQRADTSRQQIEANENTRQHAHHAVLRHGCQNTAQAVACKLLQSLRHRLHSEEEQCQRAQKRKNVDNQFHCVVFNNYAAKVLQSCNSTVTQMLQFCYNRRCNPSITLLKHVCNIQHVLLHRHKQQTTNDNGKRESRKNHQVQQLAPILHLRRIRDHCLHGTPLNDGRDAALNENPSCFSSSS